jgi:hypothetical protein
MLVCNDISAATSAQPLAYQPIGAHLHPAEASTQQGQRSVEVGKSARDDRNGSDATVTLMPRSFAAERPPP